MAKAVDLTIPLVYVLGTSDSLGMILSARLLNGNNYLTWLRVMRSAVRAKNKIGRIDGTIQKPRDGAPLSEQWTTCNSMLIAQRFNTLDKNLQVSVAYAEDVKVLWDDLKERFSQGNETRIHQIKTTICLLQWEGLTVPEYYSKMKGLWDELRNYLELPNCTCEAVAKTLMQRERERVHQFLMNLNVEFSVLCSNILSTEPVPTLNKIFSIVVHEERQKLVTRAQESGPEVAAFIAKIEVDKSRNYRARSKGIFCDHCRREGHVRATCFLYPKWWDPQRRDKQLVLRQSTARSMTSRLPAEHNGPNGPVRYQGPSRGRFQPKVVMGGSLAQIMVGAFWSRMATADSQPRAKECIRLPQ